MSEMFNKYETVHASRVMTRAFVSSRALQRSQTTEPSPARSSSLLCTVLTLDEVRSDVLGVTDGSAVIGREEMKNSC